jgi:hypothetical protein
LEVLAAELDDTGLELDPACAVACARLLDDEESLLRDGASMRARVEGIRAGFTPARGRA